MVLDSKKILVEIKRLQTLLKKTLQKEGDFEEIHEEIKSLCSLIFKTKSEWSGINIQYPVTINTIIYTTDGEKKEIGKNSEKKQLAIEELEILEKAKKTFSLKVKLKLKQETSLREDIKEIKKYLKKLDKKQP